MTTVPQWKAFWNQDHNHFVHYGTSDLETAWRHHGLLDAIKTSPGHAWLRGSAGIGAALGPSPT